MRLDLILKQAKEEFAKFEQDPNLSTDRDLCIFNHGRVDALEQIQPHINRRDELLQVIGAELNRLINTRICDLEVVLYDNDGECLRCDIPTILDYIANDIYWNEESCWSAAIRAEIKVM